MRFLLSFILILICSSCTSAETEPGVSNNDDLSNSYEVVEAFPNLSFNRPVDLQHPGDGTHRLFVVEQSGVIHVFENDPSASEKSVFLDITDRVEDERNEEGLLGLAFHPDFETNGTFYVNYTTPGASDPDNRGLTHISRFQVDADHPDQAVKESEEVILSYDQPFWNHNGGQIAFGPDGYLYIAVGDGGSGGDPQGHGQDRTTLLGTILRIDVDRQEDGNNYAIPADNPFAGNTQGYREEIFAYGLRNPWRFSFDAETGRLWTGDVGQNAYEEIDVVENGGNYGWNIMEGNHCFEPSTGCDREGLELPVWDYSQESGDKSITGGFV
ncbi:MAG: PQQ-dependent sugar dehydrogenase, partial [Balneolaceae bacterium]